MPVTRREESVLIPPVLFVFDSTAMLPCGEVSLHAAREVILAGDGVVQIEGHADGTGDDDYNVDLSHRRAERVHEWLVDHGVDPERLRVAARGETSPLENETSDEFRQFNRRVTFRVTHLADGTVSDSADVPIGVSCEAEESP